METFLGYAVAVIFVTIVLTIKEWFVAKNSENKKDKKQHSKTVKNKQLVKKHQTKY